jgi:LAO/AO transport system kinase
VVLVPGLGDSIQTIKAGLMEIADIFIVNKGDLLGADQTMAELESLLEVYTSMDTIQNPTLIRTSVKDKTGFESLLDAIDAHHTELQKNNRLDERRKTRYELVLVEIIRKRLMGFIYDQDRLTHIVDKLVTDVVDLKMDPYSAADKIFSSLIK